MKYVQVKLTIPQAMAVRHKLGWMDIADKKERRILGRALSAIEDAIESVRGQFVNRFTDRKDEAI